MPLRVACQMDPIDRIDIGGDSTFALLLEAQRRGHQLFYYTPPNLALDAGRLLARGATLAVEDRAGDHYRLSDPRTVDLSELDAVLLRQDPPFDMAYITTTHLLERIHPRTLVVNDPASVRNAPEKVFVLDFLDLMPPTLVTRSLEDVKRFRAEHKDIILKPLYGNGGSSIFRVAPGDTNLNSLVELFLTVFREPFMVQQYRPEVRAGDKRIILVDGEVAGAVNRVPAADETRSNLHVGGTAAATDLGARDREILRPARAGAEAARAHFHGHRRDRRLSDGDQRHLAHGHPPGEGVRRAGHRRPHLGRDRAEGGQVAHPPVIADGALRAIGERRSDPGSREAGSGGPG